MCVRCRCGVAVVRALMRKTRPCACAPAPALPRSDTGGTLRRGGRIMFGDQTLFCRAADFARVRGFDPALPIMEDADLCIRMHMAGPAPPRAAAAAAAADAAAGARAAAGRSPVGGAATAGSPQTAPRGPVPQLAAGARAWARRRGRVRMVLNPPSLTSGRRLAAWGNPWATYVHVVLGMSWYLGATPEQLVELYERLYTDRFR